MTAYYNEIDPYAAQWLRNLIDAGHIAPGYVDERSIEDILPADLDGFTQCHFFAGIGAWSLALRNAGWPDDKQVWTGSCPCQPFSSAGKGKGIVDERHLWPAWFHLIEQHKPTAIYGEQVASKDGLGWLDIVQTDLEGSGYTFGANDICAAGIGAPHIRQRLWIYAERMAYPGSERSQEQRRGWKESKMLSEASSFSSMADPTGDRQQRKRQTGAAEKRESRPQQNGQLQNGFKGCGDSSRANPTNGMWSNSDWLLCRDNKYRPVESGTFPLANGIAQRVGRLRAYGNAINAEVAKVFIESTLNTQN